MNHASQLKVETTYWLFVSAFVALIVCGPICHDLLAARILFGLFATMGVVIPWGKPLMSLGAQSLRSAQ